MTNVVVSQKPAVAAFAALSLAVAAFAAPIPAPGAAEGGAPSLRVGDAWVYDDTFETGTNGFKEQKVDIVVERVSDPTMLVGVKLDGSPAGYEDHEIGLDWSKRELIGGEETITTRPFDFPMSIGKTWSVDYVDPTRRGNQLSDHVRRTYRVTGWREVTVPAGTFQALEVEAHGTDELTIQVPTTALTGAAVESGAATSISHTQRGGHALVTRVVFEQLDYAPKVGALVKSVEERYNDDNVRLTRQTRLLTTYKPAG